MAQTPDEKTYVGAVFMGHPNINTVKKRMNK